MHHANVSVHFENVCFVVILQQHTLRNGSAEDKKLAEFSFDTAAGHIFRISTLFFIRFFLPFLHFHKASKGSHL
jgi:hypothetical protein